jgi:polar amino acid transport system substrate-binding protein
MASGWLGGWTRRIAGVALGALALACAGGIATVRAQQLETVEPGKLLVAYNGDMPGTSVKDGKLIGLDGELMQWVGEQLGLKVEPVLMEWAAEIQAVKSRRVDAMHGMMGWTEERTKVINITDPIYYGGANITQKKDTDWSTVKQLEGRTIASIQGFGWNNELKSIKGVDFKLYETSDAAIRDLLAGRIEALFADPPLIQYAISKNPDWPVHAVAIRQEFDSALPTITGKYNIVFGLSKDAPNLLKAFNQKIAEIWATCRNLQVAKGYGLGEASWFEPGSVNTRAGLDRPKDWQLPASCGG